jgi:hypothetical protein
MGAEPTNWADRVPKMTRWNYPGRGSPARDVKPRREIENGGMNPTRVIVIVLSVIAVIVVLGLLFGVDIGSSGGGGGTGGTGGY